MKMKLRLFGLILVEVFLLVLLVSPVFVDRHDTARAVAEVKAHASVESDAIASALEARDRRDALLTKLAVLACAIGNGILIFVVAGKIRRQSQQSVQPTAGRSASSGG